MERHRAAEERPHCSKRSDQYCSDSLAVFKGYTSGRREGKRSGREGRKVKGRGGEKVNGGIWPTEKFRRGAPYERTVTHLVFWRTCR